MPASRVLPWGMRLRAAIIGALSVIFVFAMTGQAKADPDVSSVEAQIDGLWRQSEPLIEQYNAVHEDYEKNQARQKELEAAIKPLADQLDVAETAIGKISAQAYMGQNLRLVNAFLSSTPATLADQMEYLDDLGRTQTSSLRDVLAAKSAYDVQKAPIDELVTELATQDKDLAARKADIDAKMNQLEALRAQAYQNSGAATYYRPSVCPTEYVPTPGYAAAAFACGEGGKPYVWGAAGPDTYDCSGLTMRAWEKAGVYLPHNAYEQRQSMPYVDRADLQIGDLVFYFADVSHVAIYVGGGMVMSAPQPGDVVRMVKLDGGSPIHSFGRP